MQRETQKFIIWVWKAGIVAYEPKGFVKGFPSIDHVWTLMPRTESVPAAVPNDDLVESSTGSGPSSAVRASLWLCMQGQATPRVKAGLHHRCQRMDPNLGF